jgi:hypothetical protein
MVFDFERAISVLLEWVDFYVTDSSAGFIRKPERDLNQLLAIPNPVAVS